MHADSLVFWIGALLLWQLYATILVVLSRPLDNEQKLRLVAIIWALPFLGALYARFSLNQVARDEEARRAKEAREKVERANAEG